MEEIEEMGKIVEMEEMVQLHCEEEARRRSNPKKRIDGLLHCFAVRNDGKIGFSNFPDFSDLPNFPCFPDFSPFGGGRGRKKNFQLINIKLKETKMRKLLLIAAIAVIAAAGCKKDNADGNFVAVTDITGVTTVAEVGKPLTLAATVSPTDATNQTIVWSVKSAGTTVASISGATLNASAAGTVTVTATIAGGVAKNTPFAKDFAISVKSAEDMPTVTLVTVSPATVNVVKGASQKFTATVAGSKLQETDKAVSWTLTGGAKTGTAIAADGTLTVAADETAASLTVKATSAIDVTKSGTATVTLMDENDDPKYKYYGTWRHVGTYQGDDTFWEQIVIKEDEIIITNKDGYGFSLYFLTWTDKVNPSGSYTADYPAGYKIIGMMTSDLNGYNVPKASGSGYAGVTDNALISLYISADKQSIRMGNWGTTAQEALYGQYNKKTDVEYWWVTWSGNGGKWLDGLLSSYTNQVAKDGKLARFPDDPAKTGAYFAGWFKDVLLTNEVIFPYDVSAETKNFTLYAKWSDTPPSSTLRVTVNPGTGFYATITAMAVSGGASHRSIPTSSGTHSVSVFSGTYRIFVSYWSCSNVSCMTTSYSENFTVTAGQTKNISIINGAVGF